MSLSWLAETVGGWCSAALKPPPFPSPALTFLLLGVKSLSKETTRNFTGKSKQECGSEWIHREGGSSWGKRTEIHPEPCSGALPPKQHSQRVLALPWANAGGPSAAQDEPPYFHAAQEQG